MRAARKGPSHATLSDLDITRDQAAKWMQMAEIPEAQFEALVTQGKASTAGILRAARKAPRPSMHGDLLARIDAFRLRMGLATRGEAIRWLVTWALDAKPAPPKGE